ncbi:MAG: insulinase family protein [Balneolales bacterium]|nr:insulinase family protein [Balneolales bacterium]
MKRFLTLSVLMVVTASAVFAQRFHDEIEFPEINLFNMPDVVTFELRNGITFYLVEDNELPLINMSVTVRAGSFMDPVGQTGLASFTFSQMRNGGTRSMSYDELNELLERRAARMEAGAGLTSASASMSVLKEDFDSMLPIFIEMLRHPGYEEARFNLAKTQSNSAIARRNDEPSSIAAREFRRLIYGTDSVYGRTQEYTDLDNITIEDMRAFHEKVMVGRNLKIAVIGDFRARDMRRTLERAFRDIPAGTRTDLTLPAVDYTFEPSLNFVNKSDAQQSFIRIGHIGGRRDNPDFAALQLMNEILSGGFSGRLLQIIRTDLGLAYSVGGGYQSLTQYDGTFFVSLSTANENTAEAVEATIHQISRLQTEPVTERELLDARDRILNSLVFRYTSRAAVLNERISNDYNGLPADAFNRYIEELSRVTVADIQRVANTYIRPDALQVLIVGSRDALGEQLSQLGEYNEIDITIPRRAVAQAEVDGDDASEVVTAMAAALISEGVNLERVQYTASLNQGGMNLQVEATMGFPDALTQVIQAPQGMITIEYANGAGKMAMGPNEQPLPGMQVEALQNEVARHYLSIAVTAGERTAVLVGDADFADQTATEIFFPELNLTMYLSKETSLPLGTRVKEFNPMAGQEIEAVTFYSDWTTVDGVAMAYTTESTAGGMSAGKVTITSHTVNP